MWGAWGECNGGKGYKPIYLEMGDGNTLKIEPSVYMIDGYLISTYMSNYCMFGVVQTENVVLGQIFLQQYFTILDYDNLRIGFSENSNVSSRLSGGDIAAIVLGSVALVGLIVGLVCCCKKRKMKANERANERDSLV